MRAGPPRISIGLPVYNGEQFICQTLDSILAQTFQDFELIIADNASTDATLEICKQYVARDPRIILLESDDNHGAAWNYNRIFDLARGEFFKWAAADDICAPEFLQRCAEILASQPDIVLCYPKTVIIDETGQLVGEYPDQLSLSSLSAPERLKQFHERFRSLLECNAIFGLIRSSSLRHTRLIGRFTGSDSVLLGELALLGQFYEVPEPLFNRRDHSQTSVRSHPSAYDRAAWFDPKNRGKISSPQWRLFFEFLKSIARSRISMVEKVHCYMLMGRWLGWYRPRLQQELERWIILRVYQLPGPLFRAFRWGWKFIGGLRHASGSSSTNIDKKTF